MATKAQNINYPIVKSLHLKEAAGKSSSALETEKKKIKDVFEEYVRWKYMTIGAEKRQSHPGDKWI